MFQRTRLYWQDMTDEELEAACIEEDRQDYLRIVRQHAGKCPQCDTQLDIGVTETTVGRTCWRCGYHDFSFLYPEVE